MARVKTLSYEGCSLRIASLKLGQVEDLLDSEELTEDGQWKAVLDALTNAKTGGWTKEALTEALDFEDFQALYSEVLTVSGLKRRENLETTSQEPLDFQFIRCHLVHSIGWTFEQADDSAFSDVMSIFEHWSEFPPQHVLMAGYVGYKGGKRKQTHGHEIAKAIGDLGGQVFESIDNVPLAMQSILAQGLGLFGEPKPADLENPGPPFPLP